MYDLRALASTHVKWVDAKFWLTNPKNHPQII